MDCWFVSFSFPFPVPLLCAGSMQNYLCDLTEHQNSPHDVGPSIDQSHLTTEKNGDAER